MWIVSKRYDIAFIFGGAIASMLVPFVVMWNASLLPLLFWGWLLIFDGTHLWAAYSRTYLDHEFWKTDRALLLWSPVVIFLPAAAVLIYLYSGSIKPVEIFLVFAQAWAYYHLVRQHYGFLSLYDRKGKTSDASHRINKWTLYAGLWSPYFYFLISHPVNRKISGLGEFPLLNVAAICIFVISALLFLIHQLRQKHLSPAGLFIAVCLTLYGSLFFWIAPMEPFFGGARNAVQSFMVLAITMTLFHNIQYHAIVWHYNRKKYRDASFGAASYVSRNFGIYACAGLAFAAIYVLAAWFSTDYPDLSGKLSEPAFIPIAFIFWWGVLFHHYYLDQKIWRVSKKQDLQRQLGVAA